MFTKFISSVKLQKKQIHTAQMKKIQPNKELSDAVYVNHGKSGQEFEFPRFHEVMTDVQPLNLDINFSWGSNEKFPPQNKNHKEVDKEVVRILLQRNLFHLHNGVVIKLLPAEEKRVSPTSAYSDYVSPIQLFVRK